MIQKSFLFAYLIFSLLFTFSACQESNKKATLAIPEGKVGMIGYGSLTSLQSIEEVLGRKYQDSIYLVHLDGYERSWNFVGANNDPKLPPELLTYDSFYIKNNDTIPFQKTMFLNIIENKAVQLNCVLYYVTLQELAMFDEMELGYTRIDVTNKIPEYTIEKGVVYAYKALPEYEYNPETDKDISILEKSYVDLVLDAYKARGASYKNEFDNTTIPADSNLIAPVIRIKVRD